MIPMKIPYDLLHSGALWITVELCVVLTAMWRLHRWCHPKREGLEKALLEAEKQPLDRA